MAQGTVARLRNPSPAGTGEVTGGCGGGGGLIGRREVEVGVDAGDTPVEAGEELAAGVEGLVTTDDPHIVRDLRGVVVDANVFQYLPATETLRRAARNSPARTGRSKRLTA